MALNLDRVNVLLIEDNKPTGELIKSVLQMLGVKKVYLTNKGDDGYELFQSKQPDIVIIDWDMTPIDGIELTKKIRQAPLSVYPQVPIIMLTGYNSKKHVELARDNGVTEFLTKPFTAEDIAKRITAIVNKPRDFVECQKFVGPDRRRHIDANFNGSDRRSNTREHVIYLDA